MGLWERKSNLKIIKIPARKQKSPQYVLWSLTRKLCYRKDDRAMRPIYGYTLKIFGTQWLRPRLLFPKFSWAFVLIHPMNVRTKFKVCSFTCSCVNRGYPKFGAVLGYAHTMGSRTGLGMVPFERALVSSYRPSIVTFPLSLRVSDILPLLFSSTPLFPYLTSIVSPKFPHVPLGLYGSLLAAN